MSNLTTNWLRSHPNLDVLNWPSRGADINPIENLWADLVATHEIHNANTADELWENLYNTWNNLRYSNKCEILVNSIPNRLKCIIENGGFWSKY